MSLSYISPKSKTPPGPMGVKTSHFKNYWYLLLFYFHMYCSIDLKIEHDKWRSEKKTYNIQLLHLIWLLFHILNFRNNSGIGGNKECCENNAEVFRIPKSMFSRLQKKSD